MKKFISLEYFVLLLLILFYFIIFSALSVLRHLSLNSTYLDLGLESQVIWNSSQGRFFETSFGAGGQLISALSYHFTPLVLLISPIYRLFPTPITLLILQTLALSLGAVAVFVISKIILPGSKIKYALAASYLLYPPLQYSNLSDFHYVTLATTLLLSSFYFLLLKRWRLFYLFLILAVSTKENVALVSALFGVYLFLVMKELRRGIILFLISLVYFLAIVYLVFPVLSGEMGALGRYDHLGRGIGDIAVNLTTHPAFTAVLFFTKPKLIYLVHIFASVGFFPLLSPGTLLMSVSEFLLNLLSAYNPQWQVKFHYTAAITPFIFISAVFGVRKALAFLRRRNFRLASAVVFTYLLFISLLWEVIHSPSPLFYKFERGRYLVSRESSQALASLSRIPSSASVSAMNNLGAHLGNRRFLFRFPINYLTSDFVVVDPAAASGNFDLSQVAPGEYERLIANLIKSGNFEKIVSQPRLLVFERKKP